MNEYVSLLLKRREIDENIYENLVRVYFTVKMFNVDRFGQLVLNSGYESRREKFIF